jgi:ubiquinone/menaquinone biosynthesis C-methylase UbiE
MQVSAIEGHRNWAATYDGGPNPLLALESRFLVERLNSLKATCLLDIACGTGRWMLWAQQRGIRALGVDFCAEMLIEAARKPGLAGRLSLADACHIPVANGSADLTLCSFALGYLPTPHRAFAEMARVSRSRGHIIVTDLHPRAIAAGWTRSFRSDGQVYEMDHHLHPIAAWVAAAESAGLSLDWCLEASLGDPEREILRQAGKDSLFPELSRVPALLAMSWTKS